MTDWATIFSIGLVQNMFIAAIIASLACGIIGTFVVVKRIVFISGGIAHTTFGGVGFAYYLQSVFLVSWFSPMIGAI
ncbi:MAG: metal ABC transporter permease, partial [Candidatus Methanomethylophilaceae archaeon]|nr:metal ABC transporter permease [Candidatus Methanomethylophilaceae archaeon]